MFQESFYSVHVNVLLQHPLMITFISYLHGLCSEPAPAVPQSDVYRMLHDDPQGPSQPRQSSSFKVLQDMVSEEAG